jgi:glucuronate isomerase
LGEIRRRAQITEDAERQKKLLALAARWEATAGESEREWRHLDLFVKSKREKRRHGE